MAENLDAQIAEDTQKSKEVLIKELGVLVENKELSLKDRRDARKQRETLIKSSHTLGGDLKKNYQDLKDGITTTVDGFINETFGPLGGMVSSLTTGFFKRAKDEKSEQQLMEQNVEAAQSLVDGFQGKAEEDKDIAPNIASMEENIAHMADNQETAEDRRERLRKQGGGAGDGKTPMKTSELDLGLPMFVSTFAGIALGLTSGTWIPPLKELTNLTNIFDTKFPKFTRAITDFFGIKMPDVPKAPDMPGVDLYKNWKTKVKNFFGFADDIPKIPDAPKIPDIPGFMKTADDLVDARYARMTQDLQQTADGLKVAGAAEDAASAGGKVASKARSIMGIAVPDFMNNIITKMDESVAGLKVAAESQGIAKTAAGLGVKMAGGMFGRVFAIAGNPVFDVAAMAKDAYDIAAPTIDKDVRTQWKAEDVGGLVGGVIGGAIGTAFGMPWLGVGLGNMAGEFVGSLADNPDVVKALESTRTNLATEATELTTEVADLEAKIKELDPKSEMAKLMNAQLASSKARLKIVTQEKEALESKEVKAAEEALKKAGTEGDELAKKMTLLEKNIALAEERGDDARVAFLERQLELTEKEFETAEENYVKKEDALRKATREASATMADSASNFFDKIATEGGFFGAITSGFGSALSVVNNAFGGDFEGFGMKGKEGTQYLESQIQRIQGMIEAEQVEIDAGDERNWWGKPRSIIIKKYEREIKKLKARQAEVGTAARGGIIVNRPTYLPSSGVVVGEHGTFTGSGAARGGISDGGPEAVIPLGGVRGQQIMSPLAQSIAGSVINQLAMDRVGLQTGGEGGSQNVIDSSSTQIVNNNTIINSPEPQGPMLPGVGRDTAVSHFRHVA